MPSGPTTASRVAFTPSMISRNPPWKRAASPRAASCPSVAAPVSRRDSLISSDRFVHTRIIDCPSTSCSERTQAVARSTSTFPCATASALSACTREASAITDIDWARALISSRPEVSISTETSPSASCSAALPSRFSGARTVRLTITCPNRMTPTQHRIPSPIASRISRCRLPATTVAAWSNSSR